MGSDERNAKYLSPSSNPSGLPCSRFLDVTQRSTERYVTSKKNGHEGDYYPSQLQKNRSLVKITNVTMRGVGGFR